MSDANWSRTEPNGTIVVSQSLDPTRKPCGLHCYVHDKGADHKRCYRCGDTIPLAKGWTMSDRPWIYQPPKAA